MKSDIKIIGKLIGGGLLIGMVLSSGCATRTYCLGPQRYDKATSIPPIDPGEGLVIPQSPTALIVPPLPAEDYPFGVRVKDSDKSSSSTHVECLDQPPPLPPDTPLPTKS